MAVQKSKKMNQKIKRRWVKALRSGKYRQCSGQLRDDNDYENPQFCCLGVLCDLYNDDLWSGEVYIDTDVVLPSKVQEWAGLVQNDPIIAPNAKKEKDRTAAAQNDKGRSFKEIANMIERNL